MDSDGDGDEEMILPPMNEVEDPAVLAALPPLMQLDLLVSYVDEREIICRKGKK